MPDRPEVRLGEYQSVSLSEEQLTDRDLTRLRGLQAQGRFTIAPDRTGWRLTADATVGVLVLDRLRLVITPKFALTGDQLIRWLCYALGTPVPHQATTRRWATDPDGLADLVASALLVACQELLRDGLRRDYLRKNLTAPVLRGRLDIAAQATKRYGMLDQLHMRTFERDADVWENRVCGTALAAALPLIGNPALARQAADTAAAFPRDGLPTSALRALDRATYTRLNARYRTAHLWAGLLLRGGGVTDLLTDLGHAADSLLLDLPALWEAVVRRLATEAVAPLGGAATGSAGEMGITTRGDLAPRPPFRPDILLRVPVNGTGPVMLPVDAKYKRYGHRTVSAADVHQLLTYVAGYATADTPTALIVYPQPGGFTDRTLRVTAPAGTLGEIRVLGVDPAAAPDEATAWLRTAMPLRS